MRKTFVWLIVVVAVAAAARAERPVDETRPAAADARISIENVAGSVTVIGGDAPELRVTGTLGEDVEELAIDGDEDSWSIEVVIPERERRGRARKIAAGLEVRVPRGARVEIEAVSASVDVQGVSGEIEAASVSGGVDVAGDSSDVEVESVSGAVSVRGGVGTITAESVSGALTLEDVSGDLEATTVSGRIRIEAGAVDEVEIETLSGGVYFKGGLTGGSLEVESHSGNVEVLLPAALEARFELVSFSGRIDNGFGPPARRTDRYEPGSSVEFSTGAAEAEVSIETFSGNIVLEKY